MKPNSTIVGLLVGLIGGILLHVVRTASPEVTNSVLCALGIAIVVFIRVKYSAKARRDEQLVANGLNHYRHHIHHRRVIKKTS